MAVARPVGASSEGVRKSMQANKSRDTKPELALRRAVHALGLRYRVAVRPLPKIRRTADLVFTKAQVAVFLDGCFWHGCPEHHIKAATNADYWAEKVVRNRERDAETDRKLSESGWLVIRVWEHEDPKRAAVRIAEQVWKIGQGAAERVTPRGHVQRNDV
ncbi:very short patch repair endonuclease [Sphaerisporangium sp. NPDC049002]|uniref:very short patch repair endonuclease n=1 Tax=Sphaerisporangium sp. NPDC049002 TaxID=3155392 RepID=UPI003404C4BE